MSKATEYLKAREWSMGNGQCPDCCGVPASWHGHPGHMTPNTIGHHEGCLLADALVAAGEHPLMIGEFKSDAEFEPFITEGGIFGTRPKTADGCPRYRSFSEELRKACAVSYDFSAEAEIGFEKD